MARRNKQPYEKNRWWTIENGNLYFVLPGGKRIFVREAKSYDLESER